MCAVLGEAPAHWEWIACFANEQSSSPDSWGVSDPGGGGVRCFRHQSPSQGDPKFPHPVDRHDLLAGKSLLWFDQPRSDNCCHKHASSICCRSPDFISVKLPPAFDGQAGRDLARSPSSLRWMDHPGARHNHFLSVRSSGEGSTLPRSTRSRPTADLWLGRVSLCLLFHGCLGCSCCRFSARS